MGAQSQHHAVDGLRTLNLKVDPLLLGLAHPCLSTWPAGWMAPAEKHVAERVARASPRPPPALAHQHTDYLPGGAGTLLHWSTSQGPQSLPLHSAQHPWPLLVLHSHFPPLLHPAAPRLGRTGVPIPPVRLCRSPTHSLQIQHSWDFSPETFLSSSLKNQKTKNPLRPLVSAAPCILLIEISASHQPPAVYSDSVGFRPAQFCPCQPSAWHQETLSPPRTSVSVQN